MDSKGKAGLSVFVAVLISIAVYASCLNHLSVNRIGVAYNSFSGEVRMQEEPGWYFTSPFTLVAYLDTRPMRVMIPSNARIINQKLVRFKKEGLKSYIETQGFEWLMLSYQENVMLGYAFSGENYHFLEILEEPRATKK